MSQIKKVQRERILLSIPAEVRFLPTYGKYDLSNLYAEDDGDLASATFVKGLQERNEFLPNSADPPREIDIWETRSDFLDSETNFEVFTYCYGQFGPGWPIDLHFNSRKLKKAAMGLENDFKDWRELIRTAMVIPRLQWASLSANFASPKVEFIQRGIPLQLVEQADKLVAVIELHHAIDAVLASVWLDHYTGAQFKYCDNCGKPFRQTNKHGRIYCSTACGHYVAVKKSRERARSSKGGPTSAVSKHGKGDSQSS